MTDVIIIGAGVSGCAIARELSRWKLDILVVEQQEDVCCGTSKANSAIVHAGFDAAHGTLMAQLNVQGSQLMEDLAKELDFPYRRNGSLVVMHSELDRNNLEKLLQNGIANGVQGLQILEKDALMALEPNISETAVAALYAPTGAIVCPFGLTYALAENAAHNGVRFQFNTLVQTAKRQADHWLLSTSQGELTAKVVINAAGVYADLLHNQVSDDKMQIIPRRGEYFLLDKSASGSVRHTIFQLPGAMGKGVLISPTVHGNLLVGPSAQDIDTRDNTQTTANGLEFLKEKAAYLVKNIPFQKSITNFSGLRAHEIRHEFRIGEAAPGWIDCAGIESPGLSSAPAIGKMVEKIAVSLLNPEKNPTFCATRKRIPNPMTMDRQALQRLIRQNPSFGNIICRCESITEGEIVEAIHRTPGARSIDGIKRRTRAGMGRCQGGFCSPKVMEILIRELNCTPEQLTKSGGTSYLLTPKTKSAGGIYGT